MGGWGGAETQIRVIFKAPKCGNIGESRRILQLPVAATVVWCGKLIHPQYEDELQHLDSISKGVSESIQLNGSESKSSNLEKILGNIFIGLYYQLDRGMRGREPLEIIPNLA